MNCQRPTELYERANADATTVFAEHMNQFKGVCDVLREMESQNVREVLRAFMRDQRQVLNFWKDEVKAQVMEHLDEKYPHQDMGIVVAAFEIKMERAISEMRPMAQSQSRGIRV